MLHYSKIGSGFPIVLLHGFCENRYLWSHQMNALQHDFKLISFDLTGFGDSKIDPNEDEYSIEYLAEQVHHSLEKMGVAEYILIGHSLGGYVALAFAEKYPQRLKGLGMFHSTAFADSEEKKQNRDKTLDFIKRNGVDLFAKSFVQPLFSRQNRDSLTQEIADAQEIVQQTPVDTILKATEAMKKRPDRTYVLKSASYPVLYVIGKEDLAVPLAQSEAQCYIPQKNVVHILEQVAHMGMIEAKEKSTEILREFAKLCEGTS